VFLGQGYVSMGVGADFVGLKEKKKNKRKRRKRKMRIKIKDIDFTERFNICPKCNAMIDVNRILLGPGGGRADCKCGWRGIIREMKTRVITYKQPEILKEEIK